MRTSIAVVSMLGIVFGVNTAAFTVDGFVDTNFGSSGIARTGLTG